LFTLALAPATSILTLSLTFMTFFLSRKDKVRVGDYAALRIWRWGCLSSRSQPKYQQRAHRDSKEFMHGLSSHIFPLRPT
jgi:hypothetical protein